MAKAKKKQMSELAQKKRSKQDKKTLNPFEVHINKEKQKVLGRKSKVDKGLPGVSRAKAIGKRKGTLLQEYKQKNKDNVFLDKRIGERNSAMSTEDKAIARFAAARMKAHKKKSMFSLNDEEILTHKGQTLEEIEKFDDPKSDDEFSDDDNKAGKLDKKFVGDAHFGGGVLSKPDSAMSRKDLIDQLIAESKKRKAEKQKIREQTIDLTEKLDTEWRDLLPIVTASNKAAEVTLEKTKADDYDIAVRELKFEARGVPSEKLKSEEEIVREEKEKLETLEADRLARMKGFMKDVDNTTKHKSADDLDDYFVIETVDNDIPANEEHDSELSTDNSNDDESEDDSNDDSKDDDSDNDGDSNNNDHKSGKDNIVSNDANKNKKHAVKSLNKSTIVKETTSFNGEENKDTKKKNNESSQKSETNGLPENTKSDSEDAESEGDSEDNLSDLKETESSSEDENPPSKKTVKFSSNLTDGLKNKSKPSEFKSILKTDNETRKQSINDKSREEDIRKDLLKRKEVMERARKELPYTFAMPESFEELQELLNDRNAEYQSVIIDRIIKCNHWTLDKKNKEKLSNLFLYLLQHLNNMSLVCNTDDLINCFQIFDRLSPYLYDLAHVNPMLTQTSVQEIIKEKHEDFEKNKKRYPDMDTLLFFKLVSLLFPTSDFRHPVVTPCLVFMSQILLRSRVKSRQDISKGIFICTLILEYTALSKRFAPSVINFLRGIIYSATPKHLTQGLKVIPPFKTHGDQSSLLVIEKKRINQRINPNGALMEARDLVEEEFDDKYRIRVLLTAVKLLSEFRGHLEELEAVYSIFVPVLKLLKVNSFEKYPECIKECANQLKDDLEELNKRKLEYIVREKKRPKALRMYEPCIQAVYDGKRHKPMSKEKAEREKLLHKYKKEMKGAMREIRRDRSFLAKVKITEEIKSDAERKRKVKEIFGEAATQQSELKKLKRKK
ncbi:hypothetical protein KM043_001298 [Ampulex compressa]|nr:hypothetical protein KM043_001298 [Ampulex compressa]